MAYPQFPKDFLFGSATSAYQIEGGWNADGKGLSSWDSFTHTPGKIKTGENGDTACQTYPDFQSDIAIMQQLGLKAYRFSTSWSRVLPAGKGQVNQAGLDYYNRLVDGLLAAGITPYLTLFHWDMPQSLMDECGGFAGRVCCDYFVDYTEIMVKSLGDRVKNWITLNEPWEHAALGYFLGEHAPGKKNPWTYFKVAHHQLLAHGMAVERIRALSADAQVGITLSYTPVYPRSHTPQNLRAADLSDQFMNQFFLDGILKGNYPEPFWSRSRFLHERVREADMQIISQPLDFVGLNYYSRAFAHHAWYVPFLKLWIEDSDQDNPVESGKEHTSMGWEIFPQGIYDMLKRVRDDYGNLPLHITENGAAFEDQVEDGAVHDIRRVAFLQDYLSQVARAVEDGINLQGYFYWSLFDNFEWAEGFSKRFGLVHVDFNTQQRNIKDSGLWFAEMIRNQQA